MARSILYYRRKTYVHVLYVVVHFIVLYSNQPNIVRLLLEKKADCNPVNKSRCTPLHVAVSKSHDACVKHVVAAD